MIYLILGDNANYLDAFNCAFMKEDLLSFADQFSGEFSNLNYKLFILSIAASILGHISLYFLIIALYHYSEEARQEERRSHPKSKHLTQIEDEEDNLTNAKGDQVDASKLTSREYIIRYLQGLKVDSKT